MPESKVLASYPLDSISYREAPKGSWDRLSQQVGSATRWRGRAGNRQVTSVTFFVALDGPLAIPICLPEDDFMTLASC